MTSNWNDLQFFLAIYEAGSLAGAARKLNVDETTVGRRLAALEQDLASKLFERKREGYRPTPAGHQVLAAALPIRSKLRQLHTQIEGSDQSLKGTVKLTLPETMAVHLVIPRLAEHLSLYPDLKLEFLTSAQTVNISKREADIAIRMFRPKEGMLYAKRLGKLRFSFFASQEYIRQRGMPKISQGNDHSWVNYPDSEASDAEAALLKKMGIQNWSKLQVNNRTSMLASLRAGLGVGMLPEIMAQEARDLFAISELPPLDLDTWMVVHSDLKTNARVKVTADFLAQVVGSRLR